jgi:hypothetical protein
MDIITTNPLAIASRPGYSLQHNSVSLTNILLVFHYLTGPECFMEWNSPLRDGNIWLSPIDNIARNINIGFLCVHFLSLLDPTHTVS